MNSTRRFFHLFSASVDFASGNLLPFPFAEFVLDWLVQNGIEADRLSAKGNGSKFPLAKSTDAENRWKNRRVEFILIK